MPTSRAEPSAIAADPAGRTPEAAPRAAPLLRGTGLTKQFGEHAVLRGIDLEVMPGDRIAILGASGSGKSTLLRCLNFMERPSAGMVELAGQAIGRASPGKADAGRRSYDEAELTRVRQRVGMVFQQFNLFPHMTALGNVMEGLRTVRGQSEPAARRRAEAELARVGLADKAPAYPARLSGGQKQRVAIARALAMTPQVMFFDEATSALDPELVKGILELIADLGSDGMTMVVVTHEMGFARSTADAVVFMDHGKVVESGPPEQVFEAAETERLQRFLSQVL